MDGSTPGLTGVKVLECSIRHLPAPGHEATFASIDCVTRWQDLYVALRSSSSKLIRPSAAAVTASMSAPKRHVSPPGVSAGVQHVWPGYPSCVQLPSAWGKYDATKPSVQPVWPVEPQQSLSGCKPKPPGMMMRRWARTSGMLCTPNSRPGQTVRRTKCFYSKPKVNLLSCGRSAECVHTIHSKPVDRIR